jgi:hypothetical protein
MIEDPGWPGRKPWSRGPLASAGAEVDERMDPALADDEPDDDDDDADEEEEEEDDGNAAEAARAAPDRPLPPVPIDPAPPRDVSSTAAAMPLPALLLRAMGPGRIPAARRCERTNDLTASVVVNGDPRIRDQGLAFSRSSTDTSSARPTPA